MYSNNGTTFKGSPVIESYLMKKKERPTLKLKTSLKYFKFDIFEKTFSYKDRKESPEIKVIYIGKDLKGFEDKLENQDKNLCDWPFGFKLITTVKTYVLYVETKEIYFKWIRLLNFHFNKVDLMNSQPVANMNNYNNFQNNTLNLSNTNSPTNSDFGMSMTKNHLFNNRLDFNEDLFEDFSLLNDIDDDKLINQNKIKEEQMKLNNNGINKISNINTVNNNNNNNHSNNNLNNLKNNSSNVINSPLTSQNNNLQNNKIQSKISKNEENFSRSRNLSPEQKKKNLEDDYNKSELSGRQMTEYVINNVRNGIPYREEDLKPKKEFKVVKKEATTTKIVILGDNSNVDYLGNNNTNKMTSDNYSLNENIHQSKIKTSSHVFNNLNDNSIPQNNSINKKNIFNNLNDSIDEEVGTKLINRVMLPEGNQVPIVKIPFHSSTIIDNREEIEKEKLADQEKKRKLYFNEEGVIDLKTSKKKQNDIYEEVEVNNQNYHHQNNNNHQNSNHQYNIQNNFNNLNEITKDLKFSKYQISEKVEWNDLNDDWVKENQNPSVNQLLKRENKIVLKSKEIPKEKNLFDDPHLHIKKSVQSKKVSIENLHFSNTLEEQFYNNIEGKISTKPKENFREKTKIKKVEDQDLKFDDTRTIRFQEGDVNVKRKILKNEIDQNSFTMNLLLPEQMAKFGDTSSNDRIKAFKEKIFNPVPEHPVYLGRPKNTISHETTIMHHEENNNKEENVTGIEIGENQNQQPIENNNNDNSQLRMNYAELIMKPLDKKRILNDIKNSNGLSGNLIRENVALDEFHTTIVKTYKMDTHTFLGDEYHLPASEIEEPKKEKEFVENENTHLFADGMEMGNASTFNFNQQGFNNISLIGAQFSKLDIDEVWDNSIIEDDFI